MNFSLHQKNSQTISAIFLLPIFLFIQISSSFHWDGNILYDLETNTQSDFIIETADWIVSNYQTAGVKFYNCANSFVMGGYGVLGGIGATFPAPVIQYFQRTYSSLPTHNQIYLQMTFFQLDSWDFAENDHFSISIDGTSITGWALNLDYSGVYSLCGDSWYPDFVFTLSLAYPHSASSLTLRMISSTNEDTQNESFGFRDIKIEFLTYTSPYFSLCAPGVPSSYLSASRCQNSCTSSGNSITPANYGFCFPSSSCSINCKRCSDTPAACTSCPTGSFLVDTTCYPACNYPLSTKLLGGVTYCETPCSAQYVWWDGTCSSPCSYATTYGSYAIVGTTVSSFLECQYPCATNQYLYWNASCLSSCQDKLIITTYKDRKFCEYPCASSDFLYWNGSCLSTCPSPLSPETQGSSQQRKFCWYTCPETQYLYWNGSCSSNCLFPLVPETQSASQPRNFCWYPCQPSEYLYWNGSCLNSCPSPLASETQGTTQQRHFCWYPCSETQYLYWNGSCIDSCPYPLMPEIQQGVSSSRNFCWYSCQPSEYLYWNGSCINNCPSPLSPETQGITKQRNFCWYTCSETQYLYWNESCIDSCPYPLTPEIQQGVSSSRNFCWYSCQPSEYLFWNGSCINNCPSPLSPETQGTIKQRNFCWYTCDVTEYLYWNQSCSSHCPIPLVSFDLSGNLFCFLPCAMPTIYWYQDLSCRQECNFPYVLLYRDSVQQCLKPCARPSEYFYDLEKKCDDTCNPPYIRQIINTIKVCHIDASTLSSETDKIKLAAQVIETLGKVTSTIIKTTSIPQLSTPRSALLIQLSALIQYIRYMEINYPWRVQLLFQSNDASLISLNIDFSIPDVIQSKFDNYPLPEVFEKYSLDSNFISNMWNLLTTLLLVLFGILALLLLKPIFKKRRKINHIIVRVLQSLRWNIPLSMISGGVGEIIFYASLQIRNTPLDSTISIISFLISLYMLFWILVILVICLKLLRDFHQQRRKINPTPPSENQGWLHKWEGYEILYEEIEEESLFSLAYMAIYVIRAIFFFVLIANFYDYPLTQIIIINVINLMIFAYLLYYKPLKDMWNTIQLFINEILGNILTVCVLILAIMDRARIEARYTRVTIGNVMILVMFIFYILAVVFLVIEGILFSIEIYKTWKEMRARGVKSPLKMIQILLFGETSKTSPPEEITLELSQNSKREDTASLHTQRNYLAKAESNPNIHSGGDEIKGRNSSIIHETPLDSSRFFFPIRRVNPIGLEITESDIQNTGYGKETSHVNRPMRRIHHSQMEPNKSLSNEMNPDENTSRLGLSTIQPSSVEFIRNWGNLKARMKRFNHSIHKIHWSDEE